MSPKVKLALASIIALTSTISFSTSASATSYGGWIYNSESDKAGMASWTEDGDKVTVCDIKADGWGVNATLWDPINVKVMMEVYTSAGNGSCNSVSKNISETIRLKLHVCLEKNQNTTQLCKPDQSDAWVRWF